MMTFFQNLSDSSEKGKKTESKNKVKADIEALKKELPSVDPQGLMDMTDRKQWYYNSRTKEVEYGKISPYSERMGPYGSREEAEKAVEIAAKRNQVWEAENKLWKGIGEEESEQDDNPAGKKSK